MRLNLSLLSKPIAAEGRGVVRSHRNEQTVTIMVLACKGKGREVGQGCEGWDRPGIRPREERAAGKAGTTDSTGMNKGCHSTQGLLPSPSVTFIFPTSLFSPDSLTRHCPIHKTVQLLALLMTSENTSEGHSACQPALEAFAQCSIC